MTGFDAAPLGAVADGAGVEGAGAIDRCAPKLRPPPMRRASASTGCRIVDTQTNATKKAKVRLMTDLS
jgi:hypothetical protein